MLQLLNRPAQRCIELIEILSTHRDPIPLDVLCIHFDSSQRLITSDLTYLNNKFPFLKLTSEVRLTVDDNYDAQEVKRTLLRESRYYQILEYFMEEDEPSINGLINYTDSSRSSVYRAIKRLDEYTRDNFNFGIESYPLGISGSEEAFRHFMVHYYLEAYSLLDWPFPTIDEDAHTRDVLYFKDSSYFPKDLGRFRKLCLYTAVNTIRTHQGHLVEVKDNYAQWFQQQFRYLIDDYTWCQTFERATGLEYSLDHFAQILFGYLTPYTVRSYTDMVRKAKVDERIDQSLHEMNHLYTYINNHLEISRAEFEELVPEVHNELFRSEAISNYLILESNDEMGYIEIIEQWSPHRYLLYRQIVEDYVEHMLGELNDFVVENVLYVFITMTSSVMWRALESMPKIKSLIASSIDRNHANYMKKYLELSFPEHYEFTIYDELVFDRDTVAASDYDLILTTFPLDPMPGKTVFCLDNRIDDKYFKIYRLMTDYLMKHLRTL